MSKNTQSPVFSVRPEIKDFSPYVAGLSIDEIRDKYKLEKVIKLASNEAPLGTSPLVQKAVEKHLGFSFRYPQSGNPRLREAIAKHYKLKPEQIVVGNGSDEVLDLLIRISAVPKEHNILTFKPCFSIYTLQTKLAGVELREVALNSDFSFPLEKFVQEADANTRLAFITSPDNPSGHTVAKADLLFLLDKLPKTCLLVVDEAYMDFADDEQKYSLLSELDNHPNLVICRTFSKSYGLAGLRIGYAMLSAELADYLQRVRLPFSVNILAEEAALAALEDKTFYKLTLETVHKGRVYLKEELEKLGCKVYPSQANFLMFQLPQSTKHTALTLFEHLLSRGVIIRPLKSYNLLTHLRVSVGSPEENVIFIQELKKALA
ncbi:histidinol-phosphate transaminase [Desulfovibrio litoralis]|uniref:Histidinol-phosphate aminotransferase n=1 Tax=Desulfovibrio litoralis DSM 11393 TaxID=1121455 RepID=A0A1M7TDF9_9BACT|nr:histidinol-phosphate transaminase [Desulfovibrio litoralis]SHN68755.1 histidinol phosphate aminotransferase apoenzyme [Desulfovibrio litoralis DSM 11393]